MLAPTLPLPVPRCRPADSEYVIDNKAAQGIYPEFAAYLVPRLQGREGVRILDVASGACTCGPR